MKILLNVELEDRHVEQIRTVAAEPEHELMRLASEGEVLEAMPDVDIVFGEVSEEMFARGNGCGGCR